MGNSILNLMYKSTFIAALVAAASATKIREDTEQPAAEAEYNILHESWADFCKPEYVEGFIMLFNGIDADGSGYVDFAEAIAAIEHSEDISEEEKAMIDEHQKQIFNIMDMKKFSRDRVADGRIYEDEFLNFFTQCLGGEPKAYWAFVFLEHAQ